MDDWAAVRGKKRLFWDVSDVVADRLEKLARAAGQSRNLYVQQLCDAAYSARCAPSGDAALDRAVRAEVGAPSVPFVILRQERDDLERRARELEVERDAARAALADPSSVSPLRVEPPSPAPAPAKGRSDDRPSLTASQVKIIRGLASVGNSVAKIATCTGLPRDAVAAVLKSAGRK